MIIEIRKKAFIAAACVVLLGIVCCLTLPQLICLPLKSSKNMLAGGALHSPLCNPGGSEQAMSQADDSSERFQRPSKALPYPNPYTFADFQKADEKPPLVTKKFDDPEDLILAYYGILREASSMLGYSGGCGTIGWSGAPYPYAYELLTGEKRRAMPLKQFINSFKGTGYTTLLTLLPAYAPPDTPKGTKYYMVEIETITGPKMDDNKKYPQGSYFAYYYGLVTVEDVPGEGWKIKSIDYIPEDFLCAPMHGWFYLSDAVVQIVYGDNLKLIDKIDRIEQKNNMIHIYASGNEKSYRFDFVRLANGYDILLHEFILDNGRWRETSLLTDGWENMKLTVQDSQLQSEVFR